MPSCSFNHTENIKRKGQYKDKVTSSSLCVYSTVWITKNIEISNNFLVSNLSLCEKYRYFSGPFLPVFGLNTHFSHSVCGSSVCLWNQSFSVTKYKIIGNLNNIELILLFV